MIVQAAPKLVAVVVFLHMLVTESLEFGSGVVSRAVAAQLLDTNGDGIIDQAELAAANAAVRASRAAPLRRLRPELRHSLAPGVEVGADGAYSDCPCINHVHDMPWAAMMSAYVTNRNASVTLISGDTILPRSYGSTTCHAWDHGLDECKVTSDAPKYCPQMWCYVNRSQCKRPYLTASGSFRDFWFSYTTCGNTGYRSSEMDWSTVLPIYAADMSEYGFQTRVSTNPPHGPSSLRMMTIFAHHVISSMGVPPNSLKYRAVSNRSILAYKSPYTACVHDVSIGNVDMCLGDWWFTPGRTVWKNAFVPVFSESKMLAVKRMKPEKEADWDWGMISKALAPFSAELWAVILGTLATSSVIMAFLEQGRIDRNKVKHCKGTLTKSFYECSLSFASFNNVLQPVTPAGKVFGLGIAFFLTVTGALFTANSAQFLISESRRPKQFKDLADLLDHAGKVCLVDDELSALEHAYPNIAQQAVVTEPGEWLDGVFDGRCKGAIISEFTLSSPGIDVSAVCDLEVVGPPVTSHSTGFYTTPEFYDAMKYAVSHKIADGTWSAIKKHTLTDPVCSDEGEQESHPDVLEPRHLVGNLFILMLSCAVALVLHCWFHGQNQAIELGHTLSSLTLPDTCAEHDKQVEDPSQSCNHEVDLDTTSFEASTVRCRSEMLGQPAAFKDSSDNEFFEIECGKVSALCDRIEQLETKLDGVVDKVRPIVPKADPKEELGNTQHDPWERLQKFETKLDDFVDQIRVLLTEASPKEVFGVCVFGDKQAGRGYQHSLSRPPGERRFLASQGLPSCSGVTPRSL